MSPNRVDSIEGLIGRQRPGYSLDQAFYQDAAIFERDRERIFRRHWFLATHVSEIPGAGDYRLFDVAGDSIIVIRDRHGAVRAHHNVCRHRGSRVLLASTGTAAALTCRYHGWSYALDGCLRTAPRMSEDFVPAEHALAPCHVKVVEGLIFICLAEGPAPDLDSVGEGLRPFLRLHGFADARVAHREVFPVHANWKLAVENYLECYHCKPAHPEYCSVEIKADSIGDGSRAAMARYDARHRQWLAQAERLGTMRPAYGTELPLDERLPHAQFGAGYRAPLRVTHLTGTEDGQPAAPLMGEFEEYDGGETALGIGPFTYVLAYNDYATIFEFVPHAAERSDIVTSWLVHGDARDGKDYDLDRLTWLWTVTTREDKSIIEANAAGIRSSRYAPGPASLLERDLVGFRDWYLAVTGSPSRLEQLSRSGGGRYFGI
jgi:Rieske 2Fe-2S family protein